MPKKSIADSKINRNGLPRGTVAPDFRLPTTYGAELALAEFRGTRVLLVFSDPHCGPCSALAPQLEQLHRSLTDDVQVLMISRGDAEVNLAKIKELNLTFPVVLQQQWETSRDYGMFATPIAYLIDEKGVVAADVAVGVEPILALAKIGGGKQDAEAMQSRLTALREEFAKGQVEVEKLEKHRIYLHDTMLRISGAIQVLEELSAKPEFGNNASVTLIPDVVQPRRVSSVRNAFSTNDSNPKPALLK